MFKNRPPPQTSLLAQRIARRCPRTLIAMLSVASSLASFAALAEAPYLRAAQPITDAQGRVSVIIDFADDAHVDYPGASPATIKPTPGLKLVFFHQPQVVNLVADYERRYGFTRLGITSWVGNSVGAFLTPVQINNLRQDRLVKLISDDAHGSYGAPPPWGNTAVGNETISYGRNAVNGKTLIAGSMRKVYVIDGGVATHSDLGSVSSRVNVACGSGGDCTATAETNSNYPPVGCSGHATHVAGIIGATADGVGGTAGVYGGVNMISVAATVAVFPFVNGPGSTINQTGPGWCGNVSPTAMTVGWALDYVYQQTRYADPKVPIVNMSLNSYAFGYDSFGVAETNHSKLVNLATPWKLYQASDPPILIAEYVGAFVVQSAGNGDNAPGNTTQNFNACGTAPNGQSLAYRPDPAVFPYSSDPTDGIMVVGAVHHTGQPVSPSMPFFVPPGVSYYPDTNYATGLPIELTGLPAPSNYGPCVDVWAPGNFIVSTFGDHVTVDPTPSVGTAQTRVASSYTGNVMYGTTTGWAFLSGTSMAAPHVAGAAAYLADRFNLTTPAAIEAKVRQCSTAYFNDQGGSAAKIIQLPDAQDCN